MLGATTSGDPLRYRVGTPWDFRNRFDLKSFDAWPDSAGQPMVRWRAEVIDRNSMFAQVSSVEPIMTVAVSHEAAMPEARRTDLGRAQRKIIEGHVEIRWTHGRFSGAPEAKVHLDSHPHRVPGYFPLT